MNAYPVVTTIRVDHGPRNRLTTAVRPVLAIPHAILVGPMYVWQRTGGVGLLGAAAYVLAIVSWFTLLISGQHLQGIRDFTLFYLRWRVRALAYMALFADEYPPFGDGSYPASLQVTTPSARDRVSIAIRLLLVLPHLVVLFFLSIAWVVVTILAWFSVVFRGTYPMSAESFATGVMRWLIRVEAYALLLVDEFPPFTLEGPVENESQTDSLISGPETTRGSVANVP
jgi:hypothetical protein